jgi:hypothetical protein
MEQSSLRPTPYYLHPKSKKIYENLQNIDDVRGVAGPLVWPGYHSMCDCPSQDCARQHLLRWVGKWWWQHIDFVLVHVHDLEPLRWKSYSPGWQLMIWTWVVRFSMGLVSLLVLGEQFSQSICYHEMLFSWITVALFFSASIMS